MYKDLKYQLSQEVDEELFCFYCQQTQYNSLLGCQIDFQYVKDDRQIPKGFSQENHYCYKIYDDQMIGYIDILKGYRYSMMHDDHYLWIGLFIIHQDYHRQKYGHYIISQLKEKWKNDIHVIQLGCLAHNERGLSFWKNEGFVEIAQSQKEGYCIIVLEYQF